MLGFWPAWAVLVLVLVLAGGLAVPSAGATELAAPTALDPTEVDPSARPPLDSAGPDVQPRESRPKFDGNHTGFVVGAGATWLDRPVPGVADQGLSVRAAARLALVLQLVDLELALEHASHGGTSGGSLARTELGLQVATHPASLILLFNDRLSDILAGLHAYGGVSLVRAALSGTDAMAKAARKGSEAVEFRPGLALGIGADLPLTARDLDWGVWLTVRYGVRWLTFGKAQPDFRLDDSQFLVLLGYRSYRTDWARVPRPF